MKKKCVIVLMTALFAGGLLTHAPAQDVPDNGVTQGELAMILVNVLGLANDLPAGATEFDAIALLLARGIAPLDGWDAGRPVLLADLAVVLVRALDGEDEVENPDDPQSWITAAQSLGIDLSSVTGAAGGADPLAADEQIPPQLVVTPDPPVDRVDAGMPVEVAGGVQGAQFVGAWLPVSLDDLIRVVRELPSPAVPPRPTPVTPD